MVPFWAMVGVSLVLAALRHQGFYKVLKEDEEEPEPQVMSLLTEQSTPFILQMAWIGKDKTRESTKNWIEAKVSLSEEEKTSDSRRDLTSIVDGDDALDLEEKNLNRRNPSKRQFSEVVFPTENDFPGNNSITGGLPPE